MTYCLGWKIQNSVFIVADSAVTRDSSEPITPSYSSFGELGYSMNDTYVFEALLKICVIDNVILAFAGYVKTALEIISVFKTNISLNLDIHDGLKKAISSCGPYSDKNDVSLIIGYCDGNGPRLISYNHDGKRNIQNQDKFVQVGSITPQYRTASEIIVKTFLNGNLADEHQLAAVTAFLQSYGIFDQLMKINVGGAFFGISVDANGTSWQKDTSYIIYPPGLIGYNFISLYSIDNALLVSSSYISPPVKVLINSINTESTKDIQSTIEAWHGKWMSTLIEKCNSGKSFFYTFLSTEKRLITVVKVANSLSGRYFVIDKEYKDREIDYRFRFMPEFFEILKGTYTSESGFIWIND